MTMARMSMLLTAILAMASTACAACSSPKRPNIVILMSDDQDYRLGSTTYQNVLQRDVNAKGVEFVNHYATTANCCPSRVSFMRGQFVHNTNVTHVNAPGGNYDKFVISKQDQDYLPLWMKKSGYRTEYIGKFLNGYSQKNYFKTPKHWDHVAALIDPYTNVYNTPVFSTNGERPIWYEGYHQSDVIRAMALDRVEKLTSQDDPFLLFIAPFSPHVQNALHQSIPLSRHKDDFPEVQAPRNPNWNPSDEIQKQKGSWLASLPLMNESVKSFADHSYRQRIRALQGVDEIMEDVIALLEKKGVMDNTYFIYTTDNGYKVGTHRIPAGKATFYAEDTNLPFSVRGPGIPHGVKSKIPGAHVDLVPTFLDIAGVPKDQWPPQLDGSSLLKQWHHPSESTGVQAGQGNTKEIINIEFWGLCIVEAPNAAELGVPFKTNSYKTLRIVADDQAWLYSFWCTGDVELYNTASDPYELHNLAVNMTAETKQLINRLNAILLVTKSCETNTCRQPWQWLQPGTQKHEIISLSQAMDPKYDEHFASFPKVAFKECLQIQDIDNEGPYYPPLSQTGNLGQNYRGPTDNYESQGEGGTRYLDSGAEYGSWAQRHTTLAEILQTQHVLSDDEINGPDTMDLRGRDVGIQDGPEWLQWIG
ncbi:arylsulfatase [Astrocystis sublimbata]|nr:arylsulfatase [Astrocystis sublimbata]